MPSRVQSSGYSSSATSVTSISAIFDSLPTEGNLMVMVFSAQYDPGSVTMPSGWTVFSTGSRSRMAWKVAGASESNTVTVTNIGSRRCSITIAEYAGVNSASPIDETATAEGTSAAQTSGTTAVTSYSLGTGIALFAADDYRHLETDRAYSNGYTLYEETFGGSFTAFSSIADLSGIASGTAAETTFSTTDTGTLINGAILVARVGALQKGVVSLTNRNSTSVSLSSTDAAGGSESYTYQWHRSTSSGFTPSVGTQVSGATSLTLSDTGLTDNTTYYYVLEYDDGSSSVFSDEISVLTSDAPLVVIEDHDGKTSGIWEVQGPGVVFFRMTGSLIGVGEWCQTKVEWDFGDTGSDYNTHRGFMGGHFYDVEPDSNTDYTVTCTITNKDGLSASATRTVRVTPNLRRVVYIDPDIGSASPTDPTDSSDPYDTIASCVAAEDENDLEVRFTAGKTHSWNAIFGGSEEGNNIIRSTVKGQKFTAVMASDLGTYVAGGTNNCVRDMYCGVSSLGQQQKILDPRSAIGHRCSVIDTESVDPDTALCFTGATSKNVLLQNTITRHALGGDCFFAGEGIVALGVQSLSYTGTERPFRGTGDYVTFSNCKAEYNSTSTKTAFTRSGGEWCYIDQCEFYQQNIAGGYALQIGHTSGSYEPGPVHTIVERTLCSNVTGSTCLLLGATMRNVDYCMVRNCIITGGYINIGGNNVSYPITYLWVENNTIEDDGTSKVTINNYWNNIYIKSNLCLDHTSGDEVFQVDHASALVSAQTIVISNNITGVNSDQDVRVDNDVTRLSWSDWAARSQGTGNLAKDISYNATTYRPNDTGDTDILFTPESEMGAVPEDYYGNTRSGNTWVAGAVGVDIASARRLFINRMTMGVG